MDFNRREEIRKIISKEQTEKLIDISKDELVEYIKQTQNIVYLMTHNLSVSV